MKLKRIISLTLVFAMMLTLLAAFTVSAAGKATLSYVVYDTEGKAVTGNLEADKIYEIAVEYSDVDTTFFGSQVRTTFDPEVLQLVDKDGVAANTLPKAVIAKLDVYDADEGTGTFERGPVTLEDGMFEISYNIAKELSNTSEDLGDKFELFRFRVKALKNGSAKIAATDGKLFFYTDKTMAVADVTVAPNSIRVGEVAYTSAKVEEGFAPSETYKRGEATKETVIAALEKTVDVTFSNEADDSETVACEIVWDEDADKKFDGNKAGTYTFKGAVTVPQNINYTGAVEVSATVVVNPLAVKEIVALDDVVLRHAYDTYELPAAIDVKLENDKIEKIAATWDPATVDNTIEGATTYTATIASTDDITVPDDKKTTTLKVTVVKAATEQAPTADKVEEKTVVVDKIDSAADISDILGDFIVVKDDGFIEVKWEAKKVQPKEGDAFDYEEGYQPKDGDTILYAPVLAGGSTIDGYFASLTYTVPEGKKNPTFNSKVVDLAKKSNANYTLEQAKEDAGLAADKVIGKYADGTEIKGSEIKWDADTTPAYKNDELNTYVLKGVWSDVYGNSAEFTINIKIEQGGAESFYFTQNKNTLKDMGTKITMTSGTKTTVYVVFKPEGVEDEIVDWATDNKSRATVAKKSATSAEITAKQIGTVTITATTANGVKKQFTILVQDAPIPDENNGYYGYGSGSGGRYSLLAQAAEEAEGANAAQNSVFTDLGGYEWAATQVDTLRLLGIVSGKSAGAYAPADSVTRAEYLAMLVRLLNLKANGEAKVFTDVSSGDWFFETVNVASSLGIAYGYENGAFDPNAVIKRQDMAVFAKRAMDAAGITTTVGLSSTFEDQADVAPYALDAVLYMTSVGAINGMGDGTFKPLETANRAQAAVVIYNIYAIKNK